jgi:endonuclease/exonuclease/phosphatase family metal-dependent hydrolase
MTYNVENLFDTEHTIENQLDKNDWAFLPLKNKLKKKKCKAIKNSRYRSQCLETDWTEQKLELKLNQIKRVVLHGDRPDILALVEVENRNVVSKLAKKLGYQKFIVTESLDKRGIDVAVLFNESKDLKLVHEQKHRPVFSFNEKKKTRDILEVTWRVGGKYHLSVFVNHWPSLRSPNKYRLYMAGLLKERMALAKNRYKKNHIIALGDFNTIPTSELHPFDDVLLKDKKFFDVHSLWQKSNELTRKMKMLMPLGTYFYGKTMSWNLLDRIFISKNLKSKKGIKVSLKTYQIVAPEFLSRAYEYSRRGHYLYGSKVNGVPHRYNFKTSKASEAGFSDHFPIAINLQYSE